MLFAALLLAALVPTASLDAVTLPSGAQLWLDGRAVGATPVRAVGLAPGRHTLTFTKSGWATEEFTLPVAAGASALVLRRLRPASTPLVRYGLLELLSPPPTTLRIDGLPPPKAIDPTTIRLPAGLHTVSLGPGSPLWQIAIEPDRSQVLLLSDHSSTTLPAPLVTEATRLFPHARVMRDGGRFVVLVGAHRIVGRLGERVLHLDAEATSCDVAPVLIGGRLYLPAMIAPLLSSTTHEPGSHR